MRVNQFLGKLSFKAIERRQTTFNIHCIQLRPPMHNHFTQQALITIDSSLGLEMWNEFSPSSVILFVYTLSLYYLFSSPHPHPLSIPVLYYKMQVLWLWSFMSGATMVGQKSISNWPLHFSLSLCPNQCFLVYPIFSFHGPSGSAKCCINPSQFITLPFYTADAVN